MTEERCACGHHHEHGAEHPQHTPAELAGLREQRKSLTVLQANMRKIQELHDKIDAVLAEVDQRNVGYILTQKKTLKELKKLADSALGKGKEPLFANLYAVEQDYIRTIDDLMHHAQILKRAGRGQVTPEVLANMEKSLAAAEKINASEVETADRN